MQGKGLFGFVSKAVSNSSCKLEVVFTKPDGETPMDVISLKAQGRHPAEELSLFSDQTGNQVCGKARSTSSTEQFAKLAGVPPGDSCMVASKETVLRMRPIESLSAKFLFVCR